MNGNFGRFGGIHFIFELVKAAACGEKRQIEKRCQNKMMAIFQLYNKTKLLERFINLVSDRNLVHCSPISL